MKRNTNVELVRAGSLLYVLLYHFCVVSGKGMTKPVLSPLLLMGGEVGVTLMFVISGFGVYMLLQSKECSYGAFLKGRFQKLAPEYYLCLGFLLLFSGASAYLNRMHAANLVTHVLFLHSFVPSHAGAINGVLWTMSVTMLFYVAAYWLYKLQKKSIVFPLLFAAASIAVKFCLYHVILPARGITESSLYFVYGRQIYSALDNFIVGMLVAELIGKRKKTATGLGLGITFAAGVCVLGWAWFGFRKGLYQDHFVGYIWHFVCAVLSGGLLYGVCTMKQITGFAVKPFHWVAKYSYGIYLWHLVLANTILANCTWAQALNYPVLALILTGLSCAVGYVSARAGRAFQPNKSRQT